MSLITRIPCFADILVMLRTSALGTLMHGLTVLLPCVLPAPLRYVAPLVDLVRHKPLRAVAVSVPNWKPICVTGADIQMLTWLGPLMSPSLCPGRFNDPEAGPFKGLDRPMISPDVQTNIDVTRTQSLGYRRMLHSLVLSLLSSKDSKERVLLWIEAAIRLNTDRVKMHVGSRCPFEHTGHAQNTTTWSDIFRRVLYSRTLWLTWVCGDRIKCKRTWMIRQQTTDSCSTFAR